MKLPSASGLDRAFACAGSMVLPRIDVNGFAAREGTWKHTFRENLHLGLEAALVCIPPENRAEALSLEGVWCPPAGASYELAVAYDVETGKGRRLPVDGAGKRDYRTVTDNEVAATVDAAWVSGDVAEVDDFKSGHSFVPPAAVNWQLRVGVLAWAAIHGLQRVRVGITKPGAPRDVAEHDAFDLASWRDDLSSLRKRLYGAAKTLERGETPRLAVGSWCSYCHSRLHCPAQTAMVRRLGNEPAEWAADMHRQLTPETAGTAWARLELAKKALGEVEAALKGYAKEYPLILPDGRQLRYIESEREVIDAQVAFGALSATFGAEVALKACELDTSKSAIGKAIRSVYEERKRADKKTTLASVEREALEAVRAAGGATTKTRLEMTDVTPVLVAVGT